MKRALKAEIMETARSLFGQRGYNSVSLRDIADALGISVGNLTYHFPKKESLIEAVITEQYQSYRAPEPGQDLEALHGFFCRHFRFQSEKRFYFRHYAQLADICPPIYAIQNQIRSDQSQFLRQSLDTLEQNGLLEPELFPGQREGLLQAIMVICVLGESYFEREGQRDSVRAGLESLWGIVAPCLTQEGRRKLETLLQQEPAQFP